MQNVKNNEQLREKSLFDTLICLKMEMKSFLQGVEEIFTKSILMQPACAGKSGYTKCLVRK